MRYEPGKQRAGALLISSDQTSSAAAGKRVGIRRAEVKARLRRRPSVLPGGQLERRALQLGHAAGVQVLRSPGPEERVPDPRDRLIFMRPIQ
jgi:hypothetical protein